MPSLHEEVAGPQGPPVVNPGEYIAIAAKNVGTVTSGGTITSMITFDGYVE